MKILRPLWPILLVFVNISTQSRSYSRGSHSSRGGGHGGNRILGTLFGIGANILHNVVHHAGRYNNHHGNSFDGHTHHDHGHYHDHGDHGVYHSHSHGHYNGNSHHNHHHHGQDHGHYHGHHLHSSFPTHSHNIGHNSHGGFAGGSSHGNIHGINHGSAHGTNHANSHGTGHGSSHTHQGHNRPNKPSFVNHNVVSHSINNGNTNNPYVHREETKPSRPSHNQNHQSTKPVSSVSDIIGQFGYNPITFNEHNIPLPGAIHTSSVHRPIHSGTSVHKPNRPEHKPNRPAHKPSKPISVNKPSHNPNEPSDTGVNHQSNNNFNKPVVIGSDTSLSRPGTGSHHSSTSSGHHSTNSQTSSSGNDFQNNPALISQLSSLFNQAVAASGNNSPSSGSGNSRPGSSQSSSHFSSGDSQGDSSTYLDQLQIRLNLAQKNRGG